MSHFKIVFGLKKGSTVNSASFFYGVRKL